LGVEQLVPDLLEAHGLILTGSSVHGLPDQGIGDEADEDVSPDPFRPPVLDRAQSSESRVSRFNSLGNCLRGRPRCT
jgi:hypothetical protein